MLSTQTKRYVEMLRFVRMFMGVALEVERGRPAGNEKRTYEGRLVGGTGRKTRSGMGRRGIWVPTETPVRSNQPARCGSRLTGRVGTVQPVSANHEHPATDKGDALWTTDGRRGPRDDREGGAQRLSHTEVSYIFAVLVIDAAERKRESRDQSEPSAGKRQRDDQAATSPG